MESLPTTCAQIKALLDSPQTVSALAQLVAVHAANGITSTKKVAELTGYTDRAIRKAKAELECRNQGAARNRGAGTGVPEAEPEFRRNKKKVSPTPPSKKNYYLEPTVETNNPASSAGASEALACLNGARFEIIEQMAAWISPYAPDRQSAERWLGTVVGLHGGEVVKQAFGELRAKITQGDLIARPIPLFDKICQRIKADAAKKAAPASAPKTTVTAAQYQAHIERLIGHA